MQVKCAWNIALYTVPSSPFLGVWPGVARPGLTQPQFPEWVGFLLVCALVIWICEPDIHTYREALWYCFTVVSTIGFGDVVVHTAISRILSVVLSLYAVITLAIFTGVIVNYFTQLVELRQKETLAAVLDKLERLPKLSKEELIQLSDQIKRNRQK